MENHSNIVEDPHRRSLSLYFWAILPLLDSITVLPILRASRIQAG